MWVVVSIWVLFTGLYIMQREHYRFLERGKSLDKTIYTSQTIDQIRKEMDEYKKRVDTLALKIGFKA